MSNNDTERIVARVDGNSRNRELDEFLNNNDRNWSALRSRPQADDEMPIRPFEAIKCHEAVGKDTSNSQDVHRREIRRHRHESGLKWTFTRGRRWTKASVRSWEWTQHASAGKPWSRTLTTRRGSEIEQSQRHRRMSAKSLDESGQVTRTCNSSCNAAVNLNQLWRLSVDVPERTLSCRVRGTCRTKDRNCSPPYPLSCA